MIVYQTDPDGYLMWPTTASLSPLDLAKGKKVWAIPAGCVTKEPPSEKDGYRLRYLNGKWVTEAVPIQKKDAPPVTVLTAAEKLVDFLRNNPDVRALIET